MLRKKRWIVVALGVPVVLLGGLWLTLTLMSTSTPPPDAVAKRAIPSDWMTPERPGELEPVASPVESPTSRPESAPPASRVPFESTGSLLFVSRGTSFGSETYRLTVGEAGISLESAGQFRFKVVVATVRVPFEQSLETDRANRPTRFSLTFDAPLGFGQRITAEIAADSMTVVRNEEEQTTPLGADPLFTMGTFSAYALIPILFAEHPNMEAETYRVLAFGGPPGSEPEGAGLPLMSVERDGLATLRTSDISLEVERYRISSSQGTGFLYARGREFLVFFAAGEQDDGGSLRVYRTDFFPDGVEIIE